MDKGFTMTCQVVNPDGLEKLLEALMSDYYKAIVKDWKNNKLVLESEGLVAVTVGDGIGFNDGEIVRTVTKTGNIGVLFKKNISTPFKAIKCHINNIPLTNVDELEIGHTYAIVPKKAQHPCNNVVCILKYIGGGVVVSGNTDLLFREISNKAFNKYCAYKLTKI